MIAFLDTEGTGLANEHGKPGEPGQPHVAQIGLVLCDVNRLVVTEVCLLVKPSGWTMPPAAMEIHGIPTERCERYGLDLQTAMRLAGVLLKRADMVVAHGYAHDRMVMLSEYSRIQAGDLLWELQNKRSYCTMKGATEHCQIPSPGGFGHKWPSLAAAHFHFFGVPPGGMHNALADAHACRRVFYAIQDAEREAARLEQAREQGRASS